LRAKRVTRCDRAGRRTMLRVCLTTAFVATLQCPDVVLAGMGMSGMGMGATAVLSTEPSLPDTATSVDLGGESHESHALYCCTLCSKARAMHARPPPMPAGHRHCNHHLVHLPPPSPARPPPLAATTTGMHDHSCRPTSLQSLLIISTTGVLVQQLPSLSTLCCWARCYACPSLVATVNKQPAVHNTYAHARTHHAHAHTRC
jgi:hypothetical protein